MTRAASRYWQRRAGQRPLVLGHRGITTNATENTLAAFEGALQAGADGVEFDVRLAQDGAVVAVHDATLTRITRGSNTSRIAELSLSELRAVTLPCGQRISTLDEVLTWSERHQCRLNVELKHEGHDPALLVAGVADATDAHGSPARLLFSSFDKATVVELSAQLESYVVAWLTDHPADLAAAEALGERGILAMHPKHTLLNLASFAALRQRFDLINTWTVNDPVRVAELARLGVDCVITDDPAGALRALKDFPAGGC
ncbi:MAG TPA: glycerophosphodiester phosphodiesterase family protein [Polyangiaceae bacterium]|nr:glycerophosphodiester phosphodiesterase family protein [Polyangiaceae bacterium]